MGKIIRRTVTITITETWTIVWTDEAQADETPPPPATPIVQEQVKAQEQIKAQEEADETILPAVTTVTVTDVPPDDVTPKPSAGSQRKRTRRRRRTGEQ